jgi:hypothetical protein
MAVTTNPTANQRFHTWSQVLQRACVAARMSRLAQPALHQEPTLRLARREIETRSRFVPSSWLRWPTQKPTSATGAREHQHSGRRQPLRAEACAPVRPGRGSHCDRGRRDPRLFHAVRDEQPAPGNAVRVVGHPEHLGAQPLAEREPPDCLPGLPPRACRSAYSRKPRRSCHRDALPFNCNGMEIGA